MSKVILTFKNGKEVVIPKDATISTQNLKFYYTDSDFLKKLVDILHSNIDELCSIQGTESKHFFGSKSLCLVSEITEYAS